MANALVRPQTFPCGTNADSEKLRICTMVRATKHQNRISGPILDRIDIHLEMPRVLVQILSLLGGTNPYPTSANLSEREQELKTAKRFGRYLATSTAIIHAVKFNTC